MVFVAAYLITDAAWFSLTSGMYSENIARVQSSSMRVSWPAAVACYAVLFGAAWYLVLRPVAVLPRRQGPQEWKTVFKKASVLALAVYGVYNLTNAATLQQYSKRVALVDTAWGVFAMNAACAAAVMYMAN